MKETQKKAPSTRTDYKNSSAISDLTLTWTSPASTLTSQYTVTHFLLV